MNETSPPSSATTVDVLLAIVRLESKLDSLNQTLGDHVIPQIRDHEKRIRVLERARWPLGSVAVLAAGISAFAAIVHY